MEILIALLLLLTWGAWFVLGKVPVYEVSDQARLEVKVAAHPVSSRVPGQVTKSHLGIGREVKAGEILIELDAEEERLRLEEGRRRRADLDARLGAIRKEMQAEAEAAAAHRQSIGAAVEESRARVVEARARAEFAAKQAEVTTLLEKERAASEEALRKARAEEDATKAALLAVEIETRKIEERHRLEQLDRGIRLSKLEREAVELEGQIGIEEASLRRLEHEIELRLIRAPAAGRVGEARELRPGAVITAGERLGAIVPPGDPRVVAFFSPAAVGRIRAGQPARIRLQGYSWTRYGSLAASVEGAGNEPTPEGLIRVELALEGKSAPAIPLEHGLPGSAEVEVERLSPAELSLRGLGRWLFLPARQTRERSSAR